MGLAKNSKQTVLIEVEDTGIGIPKDKLGTLFEGQFIRTLEAEKIAGRSGVGLYLSSQIIKMRNGKI